MADIDSFLRRLEDRSEGGLAKLVYTGRALSKSDTHLHLCVSSGVVLIPISEIDSIDNAFRGFNEDIIHVTVKNADRVTHALRREQLRDSGVSRSAGSNPEGPMDLTHWDHGTVTDPPNIVDACDATDVFIPPRTFGT